MKPGRSGETWLSAGIIAGTLTLLFLPVLVGGESFFGRDTAPFFYPMKRLLADSIRAGHFPLWNPWEAGGAPFFATLQPGVLYPASLVAVLLSFPHSVDWLIMLHYPLAAAGWYVLLRRWGRSAPAATLGALAFVIGGFFVSVTNFLNNLQTVAWLPWLFLAWARFLASPTPARIAAFSVLCAVGFLGGEPQLLALGLGVVFLHGLVALPDSPTPRLRQALGFGAAGVLAVALVGVQFVPFVEFIRESVRALPLDLAFTSSRSLEPVALLHLLIPPALEAGPYDFTMQYLAYERVPWLLSVYCGALVLAFAVRGLPAVSRREALFWGGLCVLGVVLALGSYSPLYRALFHFIPPIRAFRYPEKFMLFPALALPVLCAAGFDRWRADSDRDRWTARLLGALSLSFLVTAVVVAAVPDALDLLCRGRETALLLCTDTAGAARAYRHSFVGIGLLAGLGWMALRLARSGALRPSLCAWLLVALSALDLGIAHRSVNPSVESSIYTTRPWTASQLDVLWDRRDEHRFRGTPVSAAMGSTVQVRGARELSNMYLDLQTLGPNAGQLFGFPQQDGLQGVELQSVAMTHDAAINEWSPDPVAYLRAMNVRFYADATPGADTLAGLTEVGRHPELPIRLYEVADPLPRAFVVSDWERVAGSGAALLRVLEGEIDLREVVVLEADVTTPPSSEGRGRVEGATWGAERVRILARSSTPGLLVLLDRWYPGWTATVDGIEAPVLRANGVFRAVEIPAGRSDVVFRFAPRSLRIGGWISLAALCFLAAIGLSTLRKARR